MSPYRIPNRTQGTPRVALIVGLGVGVGVGVMTLLVTQLAMLSQIAVVTLRLPHRPPPP